MFGLENATVRMAHFKAPSMQHIDRRELYTSLPARVRYLHSFIDFNADDAVALESGAKYIKALIPAVVNIVYKKLLGYDITARAFTTRSTSYEGPVDDNPVEDSPQIEHRKKFLKGYLIRLCTDPTKMEFWEYMDKVGMMHVGQGRKHPLHIEYIHMGILLGYIQDVMIEAIMSHPRLDIRRKTAIIKAIGKVLWIQNDLFAKWYVRDGEEYKTDRDNSEEELEPEGVLHGKKIIGGTPPNENDESESDSVSSATKAMATARIAKKDESEGGCPFAGMGGPMPAGHPVLGNGTEAAAVAK